jgi:tuftelin-interacting protein 11
VKVIDMTGKEQRILSGYHAISSQKMLPDDDIETRGAEASTKNVVLFDMPELRHNIDMLLDRCEEELISADRKLKHNKNNVEVLQVSEIELLFPEYSTPLLAFYTISSFQPNCLTLLNIAKMLC